MKKKQIKKAINLLLVLVMVLTMIPISSSKAEAFAASRDDGTWLFPLPSNYYNSFTDWAGCPGYSKCVFCGVTHPAWGDNAHTGQGGHNGFDVGAPAGTNVYAAAPGKAYTFYNSARGNTVVIEHAIGDGFSYYSYYQHLSAFNVSSGQNVSAGTVIGKVGNTGASGGAHLHFGIVMGNSGQTGSANLLNQLEGAGWVTTAGNRNGRILNNPAASNDAGYPAGYSAVIAPLKAHYGSIHYTFNASKVHVGGQSVKPSKPTLQPPAVDAYSITFQWNVCANADVYDLYIYKQSGEVQWVFYAMKATQYLLSTRELPDGTYYAAAVSKNSGAGEWTYSDRVQFTVNNTRRIFLESEKGDKIYKPKVSIPLDDINGPRVNGWTFIYTSDYRKKTDTNLYGTEVAVDEYGEIVAERYYGDENGLEIPDGGFVISMHSQNPYRSQIAIGNYAAFNRANRTLYIYENINEYCLLTKKINRDEVVGELPQFTWSGGKLKGWKLNREIINPYETKLASDTVLEAEWSKVSIGDVDNSGNITTDDALIILKYAVGFKINVSKEAADCDKDGTITTDDALMVLKRAVGILTFL